MAGMGFFDDAPAPEPEPLRPHHPWDLPEAEFPGVVPLNTIVLGQTEQAAVAVTGLSAYSAGFEIFVTARIRPGAEAAAGDRMPGGRGPGGPRRSFRLGLQLADGTKVIGEHGYAGHGNIVNNVDCQIALLSASLGACPTRTSTNWRLPP